MWRNEEEIVGRRRKRRSKNKRRKTVLHVSARSSTQRKVRMQRLGMTLLVLILVTAGAGAAAIGFNVAVRSLFTENPRFTVTHLDIQGGEVVTADLVRDAAGLKEGINIFAIDIAETRRELLSRASTIRDITISRWLPGTLRVEVFERVPVARLRGHANYVVDGSGVVFSRRQNTAHLPLLAGYQGPEPKTLSRLYGRMPAAAIEVVGACQNPDLSIQLKAVDLSSPDVLQLIAVVDGVTRTIDLRWSGMLKRRRNGRANLDIQLRKAIGVLRNSERRFTHVDATSDNIIGR